MRLISVYFKYCLIQFKTLLEYKFAFYAQLLANAVWCFVTFAGIWIIMDRFGSIAGWSKYEVLFLYSINIFSHGLSGMFIWGPMVNLGRMIEQGNFDTMMIRPINSFWIMIMSNFTYTYISWLFIPTYFLWYCLSQLGITLSVAQFMILILIIVNATLINIGILVITGAMSFWTIRSSDILGLLYNANNGIKPIIDYPITIYPRIVQFIVLILIPYAFINYIPSVYFLGHEDIASFHPIVMYCIPAVTICILGIAYFVWTRGIKNYQGVGS